MKTSNQITRISRSFLDFLPSVLLLAAAGCTLKLVADYDEVTGAKEAIVIPAKS